MPMILSRAAGADSRLTEKLLLLSANAGPITTLRVLSDASRLVHPPNALRSTSAVVIIHGPMAKPALSDKIESLNDIELALLCCITANQSCLLRYPVQALPGVSGEIEKVVRCTWVMRTSCF